MAARHPIFARVFALLTRLEHRAGIDEHRSALLAGASGRVLEVGCGNGQNFVHYPPAVTEVLAVEPEPYLRTLAERAARGLPVPIAVRPGDAEALPAEDGRFDAVVASLVLCSVPDQARALAEMRRVLKPGGDLLFYEHVRAESPRRARMQRRVDVVWPLFAGGCHTSRDTVAAIQAAGFEIAEIERFMMDAGPLAAPVAPVVRGRARLA
ncbi:MAG TPA: methyltransferase domain-containing protein [Actinomycetota bacterium]